jgi:hypothetical protein
MLWLGLPLRPRLSLRATVTATVILIAAMGPTVVSAVLLPVAGALVPAARPATAVVASATAINVHARLDHRRAISVARVIVARGRRCSGVRRVPVRVGGRAVRIDGAPSQQGGRSDDQAYDC